MEERVNERRNYRISDFTRIFRIGRSKVYLEIKAGRLKAFKVGRATLISKEAAERWQISVEQGCVR